MASTAPTEITASAALVRQAAELIEQADGNLVGFRHYGVSEREYWPAEDGVAVAALRDALDAYHLYITQHVRVPVSREMAA